jgi:D-threo-aldose 1-dehydrogenase
MGITPSSSALGDNGDFMIFPASTDHLPLGLGGAPLGNLYAAIPETEALGVIAHAVASGCRTFDTAPHYGNGRSEHRMGHVLRQLPRQQFVLSSKTGRILRRDPNTPRDQHAYVDVYPFSQSFDYSYAGTMRSIEDSLQRLGLSELDVAYIHDIDILTHGTAQPKIFHDVITGAIPALQRLKSEGVINAYGLGVNDVQVCLDTLQQADLDCLMLAGRYSLLDQSSLATLLPLCAQRGTRIALGGVFNSGILATGVRHAKTVNFNYAPAHQDIMMRAGAIEDLCDAFDIPLRAAALQFPLAHPAVEIVMIGAKNIHEWDDAKRMMAHPIPRAFWQALRERELVDVSAPLPESCHDH